MREEIDYDTAVLAAKKGFNKLCIAWYWNGKKSEITNKSVENPFTGMNWNNNKRFPKRLSAPTKYQLRRWLRQEHQLDVEITLWDKIGYICLIKENVESNGIYTRVTVNTGLPIWDYDEIEEIGFREALKLIKNP